MSQQASVNNEDLENKTLTSFPPERHILASF